MRYVVLYHTGWGEDHFDLLIETDPEGLLSTWRLNGWPEFTRTTSLPAHRRIYLDYEGPVSGNRGTVRQVQKGSCRILLSSDHELCVEIFPSGRVLRLPFNDPK